MSFCRDLSFFAPNTPDTPNIIICQTVTRTFTPNKNPCIPHAYLGWTPNGAGKARGTRFRPLSIHVQFAVKSMPHVLLNPSPA